MLLIQRELRAGVSIKYLEDRYKLITKRHKEFPNLVLFKYDQLESPMADPLVQQCRGVILDETNRWEIIAWPFNKFFNYGEANADEIDWSSARVQEKLDGTLCVLYYYAEKWRVATSGTPDASGMVGGHPFTFNELFWRVWKEKKYKLPVNTMLTYMFELTTPFNRIVVDQKENNLRLLAIRGASSGSELTPGWMTRNFDTVNEYPLKTIGDIIKSFETMKPNEQEGYVVVDWRFHRVKVKHPGYVALHHMKDGLSPRRIAELVRIGETSEVLTHFPEWKDAFAKMELTFHRLAAEINIVYGVHSNIVEQKDFAMRIKHLPYGSILFALRAGKVGNAKEALRTMNLERFMLLMEIKAGQGLIASKREGTWMPPPDITLTDIHNSQMGVE